MSIEQAMVRVDVLNDPADPTKGCHSEWALRISTASAGAGNFSATPYTVPTVTTKTIGLAAGGGTYIINASDGSSALIYVNGTTVTIGSQSGTTFATASAPNKHAVYIVDGVLTLRNGFAASRDYTIYRMPA